MSQLPLGIKQSGPTPPLAQLLAPAVDGLWATVFPYGCTSPQRNTSPKYSSGRAATLDTSVSKSRARPSISRPDTQPRNELAVLLPTPAATTGTNLRVEINAHDFVKSRQNKEQKVSNLTLSDITIGA